MNLNTKADKEYIAQSRETLRSGKSLLIINSILHPSQTGNSAYLQEQYYISDVF